MDIRIRSLDIAVRMRLDEVKKLDSRLDDVRNEQSLISQIQKEVYSRGDTYLELTTSELRKKVEFKVKRLNEESMYARDWDQAEKDADMLRSEITALMKQAAICKVSELSNRASKQLQKIDLIMRATTDTTKMPRIYKVSVRSNPDRQIKKPRPGQPSYKPAFITSSTPVSAFDANIASNQRHSARKRFNVNRKSPFPRPALVNDTDDTKLQYVDTVELDFSRMTPVSSRRGDQTDRLTLKSVSTSTIPALSE